LSTLSRVGVVTTDPVKPRRLPGVDGVWVFIGADSVIFAILFLTFIQDRLKNPALFEASRHALNTNLGGIDTLILLTSSWSVALAIQALKPFYMWYFTLTGIHLLHVLVGTSLLAFLWVRSRSGAFSSSHRAVPESVASFWHLVDLLWIVLFPLLYLMKAA
jgi:nitric oxide reductase NorE protein